MNLLKRADRERNDYVRAVVIYFLTDLSIGGWAATLHPMDTVRLIGNEGWEEIRRWKSLREQTG